MSSRRHQVHQITIGLIFTTIREIDAERRDDHRHDASEIHKTIEKVYKIFTERRDANGHNDAGIRLCYLNVGKPTPNLTETNLT